MKKIAFFGLLISTLFANTIIDSDTGLMWQDNRDATTVTKNWADAIEYCEDLSLAGYSDWRLPNIDELLSITDDTKYDPAIKYGFKNPSGGYYWSSSPGVSGDSGAWGVGFTGGHDYWNDKSYASYVRCVRDGETSKFDDFSSVYEEALGASMASLPKPPLEVTLTKGQFEKQKDFEKRVEDTKKQNAKAIEDYKKNYQEFYPKAKKLAMQKSLEVFYGKPIVKELSYDADNEIFGAKLSFENNQVVSHNIAIKMPPQSAESFYNNFGNIKPVALFDFDGSSVSLQSVRFDHGKKQYLAMFTDEMVGRSAVQVAKLDANAPAMQSYGGDISVNSGTNNKFDTGKLISTNDLDELLANAPKAKQDKSKWLFVVGIENYKYTDNIVYAKRSADMFAKTAKKVLGVPDENSYLLINENATAMEIKNRMKMMLRNVKEGDTVYFYYNGHGVPAANAKNEPFILSNDMIPDLVADEPAFMMKQVYKELSDSKAKNIIAVVDSCFSGSTDGKSIQKGVAATRVKPKAIDFDKEKMVVLTAGKDTQYSNGYDQKAHRMFSYFVMEELIKGERDIKSLYGKVYKNTKETTRKNYGDMRIQEPTMEGNDKIGL